MVLASRARPDGHREEQKQAREPQAEMLTPGHRIELMQPACLERVMTRPSTTPGNERMPTTSTQPDEAALSQDGHA